MQAGALPGRRLSSFLSTVIRGGVCARVQAAGPGLPWVAKTQSLEQTLGSQPDALMEEVSDLVSR